jgi:hypothetical protein
VLVLAFEWTHLLHVVILNRILHIHPLALFSNVQSACPPSSSPCDPARIRA